MGVNKRAIKAMFPRDKWRIVRGDTVYLDAGKDQGQTGVVTKVIRDNKVPRAIVQGRNLVREAAATPALVFRGSVFASVTCCLLRLDKATGVAALTKSAKHISYELAHDLLPGRSARDSDHSFVAGQAGDQADQGQSRGCRVC